MSMLNLDPCQSFVFMYNIGMTVSRREQNKIEVRQSILKASRKLFTKNGYDDTMMQDIAEKAKVSKATVYNYFPNKESLLIGIEQEVITQIVEKVESDPESTSSSKAKLRLILETLVQASSEYWNLAKLITYLNSCEDSALYKARLPLENLIRQLIEDARDEGTLRKDIDTGQIVDVIMGVYLITLFQWEHIEKYTPGQIKNKLDKTFDAAIADCIYN